MIAAYTTKDSGLVVSPNYGFLGDNELGSWHRFTTMTRRS